MKNEQKLNSKSKLKGQQELKKSIAVLVGENMQRLRIQYRVNRAEIAKILQISEAQLSEIELGASRIDRIMLEKLCNHFAVDKRYFFEETQSVKAKTVLKNLGFQVKNSDIAGDVFTITMYFYYFDSNPIS